VTTAIAVYNSEGCVGRCDAKCHYAAEPECDCICGGALHGWGSAAQDVLRDLVVGDELVRAFEQRAGLEPGTAWATAQPPLFDEVLSG
jgi:hypothetical protein